MREDRPSSTATLIAAATVFLDRDARVADLVPSGAPEWCRRCLEATAPWKAKLVQLISLPALRWAPRLAERATVPGLMLHFMVRKRWIEAAVRARLADGVTQVVVIGAGFDTLALRLCAELPHARFIEIDHPATQARKRLAVERAGKPANLEFVAADLARTRLADALASCPAFRPDAPSTFIVEGLLMYLTAEEIAGVFAAIDECVRAPASMVFTVMEPAPDGRSAFHNATPLVTRLLAHWSEPFKSSLARADAATFLERFGMRLVDLATSDTLREIYLAPSGRERLALAEGEMAVVAQRADRR